MKIVNGIRVHTIDLTDRAIATIHRLATEAIAPHQALLDEIAPQLPRQPQQPSAMPPQQPAQGAPTNGAAPPQDLPPPPQPPQPPPEETPA